MGGRREGEARASGAELPRRSRDEPAAAAASSAAPSAGWC